ncbi:Transcription antitermination protein NusB [Acetobacteraceae bacterium EV16G]|uniref:Transcription antitermination protein NusB n=1 Tax=Sorlinia euscelidii TaxID=3081148 RepID=A0ABU7U5U1_9PROT
MTGASAPEPTRSRTIARVAAIQALYQCEQNGERAELVITQFTDHRLSMRETGSFEDGQVPMADRKLFESIVRGVVKEDARFDALITGALPPTWPLTRLDPVLRCLMRAGTYEICTGVPIRIVINEYLDVAHGFFSGDEPKLVHGVLDAIGRTQGSDSQESEGAPLAS